MARLIARHKRWVSGATISEIIVSDEPNVRRFVATIRGWRNWRIYEGENWNAKKIIAKVRRIQERIDKGDETVFSE